MRSIVGGWVKGSIQYGPSLKWVQLIQLVLEVRKNVGFWDKNRAEWLSIMWRRSMDDDNIYYQLELRKGGNPAFCKLMRKRKPQKES